MVDITIKMVDIMNLSLDPASRGSLRVGIWVREDREQVLTLLD